MKYLVSNSQTQYDFNGVITPKARITDAEYKNGMRTVLEISPATEANLRANKMFKALMDNGKLTITDKLPKESINNADALRVIADETQSKLDAKEQELAEMKAKYEQLQKEAKETIAALKQKKDTDEAE
jgi:flagellar motility protein MotE (MotC chaperone)